MSKCANCRKADALETPWERFRYRLAIHLFPQDFIDAKANSHTQGFGDGYKLGIEHQRERTKQTIHELLQNSEDEIVQPSSKISISNLPA